MPEAASAEPVDVLFMARERVNTDDLQFALTVLRARIPPPQPLTLRRCGALLHQHTWVVVCTAVHAEQLSDDFYELSRDEILQLQRELTRTTERNQMLRPRSSGKRDGRTPLFARIRVRLSPPGRTDAVLQMVFWSTSTVDEILREAAAAYGPSTAPASLGAYLGVSAQPLSHTATLAEAGLAPAALVSVRPLR
jgi:hypothetical protein